MAIWNRLFSRRRRYDDLSASIREHLEEKIEELVDSGMPRRQAEQAARRAFGNVTLLEERSREAWQWPLLESIWADIRYAFRQMRKNPGFAAVTIGTLALGIGAATALFTVVDHVLLRPVDYPNADRVVDIRTSDGKRPYGLSPSWPEIEQWMRQSHSFQSMAYSTGMGGVNFLVNKTESLQVDAECVSANLFETLGVHPEIGEDFTARRAENVAVISDTLWRGVFGRDKAILGRSIRINRRLYEVIGVMPPAFKYPADSGTLPQIWVPVDPVRDNPVQIRGGDNWADTYFMFVARLRPGVTLQSARTEMNVIQSRLAAQYSATDGHRDENQAVVRPYAATLVPSETRTALLALLAASLVLWLIAVVNVTNLLLARGTTRQREIAMRGALGASRARVLRQMLIEGLMLSGAGSLMGMGLALASVKLLARQLSHTLPTGAPPLTPDRWILLALLCLTLLTATLASLWPAWMAVRAPIEPALRQGGVQAGSNRRHHRIRGALVSIEIALSLSLLVSCGLLLRTIYALRQVPLGFRVNRILVAQLLVPSFRFVGSDLLRDLYNPLLDRVEKISGVQAAGFITDEPLGKGFQMSMSFYSGGKTLEAELKLVSPDVQKVFGMRMLAGRYFSREDTPTSDAKIVVNRAYARLYAPDKSNYSSLLGKDLWHLENGRTAHIIGVMDDARQMSIDEAPQPEIDICLCQMTPKVGMYGIATAGMVLAVRTNSPQSAIIPQLRAILRQAAPELEHADITTMDQVVADSYGSQRLAAHLLEGFGGAALLLCVAGLYGLLSYVVAQRTHELGVRVALGAERGHLLWLVMRQAGAMLLAGAALGTALAFASARLIRSFLYGVKAHDTLTLAAAAIFLVACGLAAAYIPARRAASVNPMEALRAE